MPTAMSTRAKHKKICESQHTRRFEVKKQEKKKGEQERRKNEKEKEKTTGSGIGRHDTKCRPDACYDIAIKVYLLLAVLFR